MGKKIIAIERKAGYIWGNPGFFMLRCMKILSENHANVQGD